MFRTLIIIGLVTGGCGDRLAPAPASPDVLAEPVPGLTDQQLLLHLRGDEKFAETFGVEDGLGPIFNSTGCETCHIGDGKGHPLTSLQRFGRYNASDGTWDPLLEHGGPQLQNRAVPGSEPERVPDIANGLTTLLPPQVVGLGYLEAVTDGALLALSDPTDVDGNGISGVPNYIPAPDFFQPQPHHVSRTISGTTHYIGRFGRKAGAIDLLHQTVLAYVNDIGITSDFITDDPVNRQTVGRLTGDNVADPEIGSDTVHDVVFYIQTLKVPTRRNPGHPQVKAGEVLFSSIGCADCHIPTLTTGPSPIAALANQTIHPYTDLLMHDMGPGLDDNYVEGTAGPSEWRTTPLWGLGLSADSQGGRPFFMHDGRAETLEQAIAEHGGEAAASRDAFEALDSGQKDQLITFLESL